jgi:hypothetical protein
MEPVIPTHRAAGAVRALALLAALAAAAGAPPPAARASTEEFSSFDVVRAEEDDESALDHLLARPPAAWRAEWERAPLAFRTSQGCFTSGQWYTHDQLKLGTPVGRRARFALEFDRVESDLLACENLDLWLMFPQRAGVLGVMFRPYYDKSRQDFALRWELGADTTRNQLRLTYGFEDLFNNLWVWRQTRVGESGQPYERHPWEPAVKAALRRERWRAEAEGRWLTLARKRLDATATDAARTQTLWGAWGTADLEARAFGVTWLGRAEDRQARSTDRPEGDGGAAGSAGGGDPGGTGRYTRRLWRTELGLRRAVRRDATVEARWVYMERMQGERAPLPATSFRAVDRVLQLEACWSPRTGLGLRAGGLFDRVTVDRDGDAGPTHGGRNESRAYVGIAARFGRLSLTGTEGIELDPERYEVWNHHDKGFLQLQTTF